MTIIPIIPNNTYKYIKDQQNVKIPSIKNYNLINS